VFLIQEKYLSMSRSSFYPEIRSTTVCGIIKDGKAVLGADGQMSLGHTVMKQTTKKVRRLYNNTVLTGFAGATADAFTLLQRFEEKLETQRGNLDRAVIDLAKDWRTDRYLRRLEAMMVIMNSSKILLVSGTGDIIEPDDNIIAIGSGGSYALSAARALMKHSDLDARSYCTRIAPYCSRYLHLYQPSTHNRRIIIF
jgi:ATP-dependent HslUV protease subunit HslV